MALVSGHTLSSMVELNTAAVAANVCGGAAEESDDDEYVYVSSLAEQIAHALMLDDEEEPPALQLSGHQPSAAAAASARSLQQERLRSSADTTWPIMSQWKDSALECKNAELMCPVSHFAAAWRDHGPTEWDCFYMPSYQQASRQLSQLYSTQLERSFSKQGHLSRGWNSGRLPSNKQAAAAACSQETWNLRHRSSAVYNMASPIRKESVGTGVFLPNIVNSGTHYRRKAGFASSKSVSGPRHRC